MKFFEEPTFEIHKFMMEDVIATSGEESVIPSGPNDENAGEEDEF